MRLSEFTNNRDNNFNLIRMTAAYAVLIQHGLALAIGKSVVVPLRSTLGMSLGSIAVDVFFIVSGYLVTVSISTRISIIDFAVARVLRIFPGLLVMLLVTVLGLGLFFTTLSWHSYLTDARTISYFLKCLTLIGGVEYQLPGVFNGNPYTNAVNGSLWTMPYELGMYLVLAFAWAAASMASKTRMTAFRITVTTGTIISGLLLIFNSQNKVDNPEVLLRLFFMFFAGATFAANRERIVLSNIIFYIAATSLILAALIDKHLFSIVYTITISYIVIFIAYLPSGVLKNYNRLGDYSYGIYIYAFPVQQAIAALIPGISASLMIVSSSLLTLLLAALSWHHIEKGALSLKAHYVNRTKKFLTGVLTNIPGKAKDVP